MFFEDGRDPHRPDEVGDIEALRPGHELDAPLLGRSDLQGDDHRANFLLLLGHNPLLRGLGITVWDGGFTVRQSILATASGSHKGFESMTTETTDEELVERYVAATAHLSQEEAGRLVGMSQRAFSDWKRGKRPSTLTPSRRRKLLEVLESGGRLPALEADGNTDLARQIDEIRNGPGTISEKERLIEGIAAAYRSAALDKEAAAARERATAARIEAEKAPGRSAAVDVSWDRLVADLRAAIAAAPHLPPQPDEAT